MKFSEIVPLNELFRNPVAYRWTEKSGRSWQGEFEVNDLTYEVYFSYQFSLSQNGKRVFMLDFTQDDDMHNTGTAGTSSVKVFASVVGMMKEFLSNVKPTELMFHGKTGEKDRVYTRMFTKTLAGTLRELGYETTVTVDPNGYHTYHVGQINVVNS